MLKQIKFKVAKTRHLLCLARINGVKALLLIDTGASNSCIALSEKENFKIREKGATFEASGTGKDKVKAVQTIRKALGKKAAQKVAAKLSQKDDKEAAPTKQNVKRA